MLAYTALGQPLRTVPENLRTPIALDTEETPHETPPVLHQIDTEEPVIFVTIDDGHQPGPAALEIVREHRMPVSLFLNEQPVKDHAPHFEEYIELGHHVHTHTLSHVELPQYGFEEQRHEICGMVEVLEETFGDDGAVGSLLRAPYGASDATTAEAAATCGITAIPHWSGTAEDGAVTLAHGDSFRPGDIIVTHFTETLPEDLRAVQQKAEAEGFTVARLEDYLP
ncbi:polysaccharide deacetylase family protein [Streptomyces sp. NPDC059853]|uniref:polysaccharide deacetylase family protein n=1 Tax=Streptomyces sp. NPDC059853 TaxID=3346973 RepID=UPI003647F2BA